VNSRGQLKLDNIVEGGKDPTVGKKQKEASFTNELVENVRP
jgi:hypothetical protein